MLLYVEWGFVCYLVLNLGGFVIAKFLNFREINENGWL